MRVTLEHGPRFAREVQSAVEREVEAGRWTGLDLALREAANEVGSVADLRPDAPDEDPELRRLMVGRAAKLGRLGLADRLRDFKTGCATSQTTATSSRPCKAMTGAGREPAMSGFALHGDDVADPVLGHLVVRSLHDEFKGSAHAIVEGDERAPSSAQKFARPWTVRVEHLVSEGLARRQGGPVVAKMRVFCDKKALGLIWRLRAA
jgi:hypothetical protein